MCGMFEDLVTQEKLEGHSDNLTGENLASPKKISKGFNTSTSIDVNNIYLGNNFKTKVMRSYVIYIVIAIILAVGVIIFVF